MWPLPIDAQSIRSCPVMNHKYHLISTLYFMLVTIMKGEIFSVRSFGLTSSKYLSTPLR